MGRKFAEIAFTPSVKAIQERMDSRESYQRFEEGDLGNDLLTPQLIEFIAERESFYIGSNNANGWPYIQFRGAKPGFLKVLDEQTLGFADFEVKLIWLSYLVGGLRQKWEVISFLLPRTNPVPLWKLLAWKLFIPTS